jgi:hypothetical protein
MPLAFLAPGYVQEWFGPGLLSGRLYAVALALVMALGVWLLARRLGGAWAAALAVWLLPLSVIAGQQYSQAVTQVLAATLLAWMLACVVGAERPTWQLVIGGVLGGALVMTRLNLAPALGLTLAYVWWQGGWKQAAWMAGGAGLVIGGLHALYWPNILKIWAYWLPSSVFPFLADFAPPADIAESWVQNTGPWQQANALMQALRVHMLFWAAYAAGVAGLIRGGRRLAHFKAAVLLAILYGLLAVEHAFASVLGDYCTFCLNSYLGFFNPLAPLLLAATIGPLMKAEGSGKGAAGLVFGFSALFGLSAYDTVGRGVLPPGWPRAALELELPRIGQGGLLGGTIPVWGLLENRYGLDFATASTWVTRGLRMTAGALMGLLAAGLIVWLARAAKGHLAGWGIRGAGGRTLAAFMAAAMVLAPLPFMPAYDSEYACTGNVIAGYEAVGAELAEVIPPGSQVYWQGGRSAALMLYLPERSLYIQQVNADYTFKLGGTPDALLRFGFYNAEIASEWLREADYILVEEDLYRGWLKEQLESDPGFSVVYVSGQTAACRPDSQVLVYVYDK